MEIENFENIKQNNLSYGGRAGQKLGVIINGENWFLKFPKSAKSFEGVNMSYNSSPLSEYIGSHIYEMLDIPVHKTMLGIKDKKVVVACKDFRKDISRIRLEDYNSINNIYVAGLEEKLSSYTSSSIELTDLQGLMIVMENNPRFIECPELKERFWDMFVVDALIGNNDRNNGNWGVLINNITGEIEVAPVFDNGASFAGNVDNHKIENILADKEKFKQSVYDSRICAFTINDKKLNPLKYIESMENVDCNEAVMRVVPKINLVEVANLINNIPGVYNDIEIITDKRKEFYYKSIEYRYDKSLYPSYIKIRDYKRQHDLNQLTENCEFHFSGLKNEGTNKDIEF